MLIAVTEMSATRILDMVFGQSDGQALVKKAIKKRDSVMVFPTPMKWFANLLNKSSTRMFFFTP